MLYFTSVISTFLTKYKLYIPISFVFIFMCLPIVVATTTTMSIVENLCTMYCAVHWLLETQYWWHIKLAVQLQSL